MKTFTPNSLEEQIRLFKYLKEQGCAEYLNFVSLENFEELSDDVYEMLNAGGNVTLSLNTCNGLTKEILERLSLNRKIKYQFVDDLNDEGYDFDDLLMLYNILEIFREIIENAENNIHKIIMICNICVWLVWKEEKGSVNNLYSTEDLVMETRSLKGSLFKGIAVCHGYALLFKLILNYFGFETTIVGGMGDRELHAWNQVKDDVFYNLDLTFDWRAILCCSPPFDNILKNDEEFYNNHRTVSFEDYSNLKKCPQSISNQELWYYLKSIPDDLRKFLVKNQGKGLYKLLEYRQFILENKESSVPKKH